MPQPSNRPKLAQIRARIRYLITVKGYNSVEKFAHENQIEQSVLSRFLGGDRDIRLSTLLRIVEALDISFADLAEAPPVMQSPVEIYAVNRQRPSAKVILTEVSSLTILRNPEDQEPIIMKTSGKKKGGK